MSSQAENTRLRAAMATALQFAEAGSAETAAKVLSDALHSAKSGESDTRAANEQDGAQRADLEG